MNSCHPVEMFEVESVPSTDNVTHLLLLLSRHNV